MVNRPRQIWEQTLRNEGSQSERGPSFRAKEQQNQQWDENQCPEPVRRAKINHGNFFQTVCDNKSCATSRPSPAAIQAGKKSRYCLDFFTENVVFFNLSVSLKICSSGFLSVGAYN